jgi:hypothetical protein
MEQETKFVSLIAKIGTVEDFKKAIPVEIARKLGDGDLEVGKLAFTNLTFSLAPFGEGIPHVMNFLDEVIEDCVAGNLLPKGKFVELIDAAKQAGFIRIINSKDDFVVDGEVVKLVDRF